MSVLTVKMVLSRNALHNHMCLCVVTDVTGVTDGTVALQPKAVYNQNSGEMGRNSTRPVVTAKKQVDADHKSTFKYVLGREAANDPRLS